MKQRDEQFFVYLLRNGVLLIGEMIIVLPQPGLEIGDQLIYPPVIQMS